MVVISSVIAPKLLRNLGSSFFRLHFIHRCPDSNCPMADHPTHSSPNFVPPALAELIHLDFASPSEKPVIPLEDSVSSAGGPGSQGHAHPAETVGSLDVDGHDSKPTGPQRSTAGCLTCRRRKVKCDERRPVCAKCTIKLRPVGDISLHTTHINIQCIWPDPGVSSSRRGHNAKKRSSSVSVDGYMPPPPVKKQTVVPPSHLPPLASLPPTHSVATSSISPETINPFNLRTDASPLTDLSMWMHPFDTPTSDPAPDSLPSAPFLHPLPSFEDVASWTFPINPPSSSRLYVPPDFLPKSLILEPGKQKTSLLPPRQKARMMADP